jgi:hypothetical protein
LIRRPTNGLGLAVADFLRAIASFHGEDFAMPFAAYNSDGVRLLSGVLADAMISARKTVGHQLSEAEGSELNKRLVRGLAEAHDSGERNPDALERAALRSAFQQQAKN